MRSASRRARRRRTGRKRKGNKAALTNIWIKSWLSITRLREWVMKGVKQGQRFRWMILICRSTMTKWLREHWRLTREQKDENTPVRGVTCKMDRVERMKAENLAMFTDPDPKKLGASPITQFLATNG